MKYGEIRKEMADKGLSDPLVRTNYGCRAHGCPNAASMTEGDLCYAHWSAADPQSWGAITHKIRTTWPAGANWGEEKTAADRARVAVVRKFGRVA